MTDIASLVIKADASETEQAAKALDRLTTSGAKAETQTKKNNVTTEQAERYMRKASIALEEMKRKQDAVAVSSAKVGAVTGQTRAGMQQLSYQLNDVATMFALGARPMQIFASQSGHIIQAVQMMTGGASKLAGFLGGPWGIAITSAAVVLSPFIAKLFETEDAADKAESALARLIERHKEWLREKNEIPDARKDLASLQAEEANLLRQIGSGGWRSGSEGPSIASLRARLRDVRAQIAEGGAAVDFAFSEKLGGTDAVRKLFEKGGQTSGGTGSSGGGRSSRVQGLSDEERALQDATKAAEAYIASLGVETARIGKNAEELKRMEIATAAAAAPTAALALEIMKAGDIYLETAAKQSALEAETKRLAEATKARADAQKEANDAFQREWEEEQAAAIRRTREETELLNQSLRDTIYLLDNAGSLGGGIAALLGLTSGNYGAVRGDLGALLSMTVGTRKDEKTGEIIAVKMGDELRKIFKLEGEFGQMLSGVLQSAGIGLAVGSLVGGKNFRTGEKIGALGGGIIGFAAGGPIGAMIGSVVGTLAGGLYKETKASIPGLIVGGILGGLPGAFLGGLLFGKAKYGTSAVSDSGILTAGNSSKNRANSLEAGQNIQALLADIAAQVGGSVGGYNVSIGQYKGKWRVSGSGMTGKLKGGDAVDFGKDGLEEAVRFALANAIQDGGIAGISPSAQNLLRGNGDIETQVQKVLAFQSVFDQLAESTDPLKYQLDQIGKEFDKLEVIFREANATTEEMAKLQELKAKREAEVAKEVGREYREAAKSLREFRSTLIGGRTGPVGLSTSLAKLMAVGSLAASGDKGAMGDLPDAAIAYLTAARGSARNATEYQRAVGLALRYTDKAIATADALGGPAQQQLAALNSINDNTAATASEIAALRSQVSEQTQAINSLKAWWNRMSPDGLSLAILTREGDTVSTAA